MITPFQSLLPLLNETLQRSVFPPALFESELPHAAKVAALPVDMYEDDTHYHFLFELPGVAKENIQIEFHEGILSVSAEKTRADKKQPVQRKFKLPADALSDSASAKLENGLLHLSFEKIVKPQPKQITIA